MGKLPTPKSYETILGDMLATFMGKIGVNDLNAGSATTSMFEAMAQAVYRSSGDTFAILRDFSVDRAEGEALKRIAREERVFPIPAKVATEKITITDTSFNKISTKVYAGSSAPNIGSTSIDVSDASLFTTTGSVYIGRGTPNVEGPLAYSSITPIGGFFRINLSTPTTKFHNISESVVLAQGGIRNIPAGTTVRTTGGGSSPQISFSTTNSTTILDGENTISGIPVAAAEPGTDSNVPRNSIKEFSTEPFTGASVSNPNPFTTGRNEETDQQLRERIKKARISRGLGTAVSVKNAVLGAQAPDENTIVTSNEIFSTSDNTTLFIDNGEGYEEKTAGIGLEFLSDSALGGEIFFQLSTGGSQTSVAKAFLESTIESPFPIKPTDRLAILVGGVLSEHIFQEGDFRSDGSATAFEIVASINSNSDLKFTARTTENATKVVFDAKEEENEFLQKTDPTTGSDAGKALGLSESEAETLRLYKNKIPLSRNGRSALIESANQSDWSSTLTNGETLIIRVDGTSPITYTFVDNDFLEEGTHATLSKSNTLQSWVNVVNTKVTGITASINGNRLVVTSNLGTSSRAKLEIDGSSTLVTKGVFTSSQGLTAYGKDSDFNLSRNTAQIKLLNPLEPGDSLTAGSEFTQGEVESSRILGGTLTLTAEAELWVLVDNPTASIITHGVIANSTIHFSKEGGDVVRLRSDLPNAFGNIQEGDYVVIWSEELNVANRLEGRVQGVGTAVLTNDFFELRLTSSEYAATVAESPVTFLEGLNFLRSDVPPQKVEIAAGSYNINTIASQLASDITGAIASVEDEEILILTTETRDTQGSFLIFTFNDAGKGLNFEEGQFSQSIFSHFAFYNSQDSDTQFPLFIHSSLTADRDSDVPSSLIADIESAVDLSTLDVDPNMMICMLNPYLTGGIEIKDNQSDGECVQIDSITGTTIDIDDNKVIRRLRVGDRYFVASPYNFDYNDSLTVVLDNNATEKTFPIPLYRRATTNTTMPINSTDFRAYDTDAGSTVEFEEFFGSTYSFKNYKAMMQARNVIDPSSAVDEDAVLFRAGVWGRAGERYTVGYVYPTVPSQPITGIVSIGEKVSIKISLKSGGAVANNIDGTTEWDVTITPNTPVAGVDEVTYTHNGTGTNPAMTTLAPGDYVTINSNGDFDLANIGTFRISSATSTSFTVRRKNGEAIAENNIATILTSTISLFEDSNTTAQEINDFVNANLTDWLSAEVIDDNGSTGAGIINKSTYEDSDFVDETIDLLDGINWISISNLPALTPNAQFSFKENLDLPSFSTNTANAYAFNNGEEIRIIPVTASQLDDFISTLAVSGITTLGDVGNSFRDRKLQITTSILGSKGAVKVTGGTANTSIAQVIGSSSKIPGTSLLKTSVAKASAFGLNADSWVRLEASVKQKKITGISFTTNATITPNSPTATQSIIELGNRDTSDRFFGQPNKQFRSRGRAFHVEKHGSLVNIAWDGLTGTNPFFSKTVEINDDGADMSVIFNSDFQSTEYTVQTGVRNFSEVNVGDSVVIQNFVETDNNGTFKVNGISDDGNTLSVDNSNGVTEATKTVALGDIVVSTEVKEGDTIEIASPFATLNQGEFRVIRRYLNSIYIENNSAVEERVVVVDNLKTLGFDATTEFDVTVSGEMKIEWNGNGTQPDLSTVKLGDIITIGTDFAVDNQGSFMITDYTSTYIICANAKAVAEAGITVTGDILEVQESAIKISEYDNTRNGDSFIITGNVLTSNNIGTFIISEIISKTRVVVNSILNAQATVQFNELFNQVFVQEEKAYTGYKKIFNRAIDPSNNNRVCILFDSTNDSLKINNSGEVSISAVAKLDFPEVIIKGIDSYKYHTGLIAQANKIVYGDPRDNVTFPGVGAAGAEINIKPPLVRKIIISINVRLNTGIPFSRITEQVRNNIAALVNSSPIGQSIAISDIISTVNSIPGTRAVSISSPTYDPQNDVIVINPAEKPFIIDIVNDIIVSKVD